MRLGKLLAVILLAIYVLGCASPVQEPVILTEKQEPRLYITNFNIVLKEVERPADATERYGEHRITHFLTDGIQKNRFDDDMIGFVCHVTTSKIMFVLENKTAQSIHILWDEAAFVDENGISHKVLHSGVKYDDRYASQPPSTVVRKGIVVDNVVSSDNIAGSLEQLSEQGAKQALRQKYDLARIRSGRRAASDQELEDLGTEKVLIKNAHAYSEAKLLFPVLGILDRDAIVEMKQIAGNSERPLAEAAYEYLARWTHDQVKRSAERHIGKIIQVLLPLRIAGRVNEYIFVFEVKDVEVERGPGLNKLLKIDDEAVYENTDRGTTPMLFFVTIIGLLAIIVVTEL